MERRRISPPRLLAFGSPSGDRIPAPVLSTPITDRGIMDISCTALRSKNGGQGRNRTADAGRFRIALSGSSLSQLLTLDCKVIGLHALPIVLGIIGLTIRVRRPSRSRHRQRKPEGGIEHHHFTATLFNLSVNQIFISGLQSWLALDTPSDGGEVCPGVTARDRTRASCGPGLPSPTWLAWPRLSPIPKLCWTCNAPSVNCSAASANSAPDVDRRCYPERSGNAERWTSVEHRHRSRDGRSAPVSHRPSENAACFAHFHRAHGPSLSRQTRQDPARSLPQFRLILR